MLYLFSYRRLEGPDRVFVSTAKYEKFNIITVLKMKNFDEEKIKSFLINNIIKVYPKFRSVLKRKFLTYYWKELNCDIAEERVRKIKCHELYDDLELIKFVKNEINKKVEITNSFAYEFHLAKFNKNQGALLIKFDHCFSDGLGVVALIGSVSENYSPNLLPTIMRKKIYPSPIKLIKDFFNLPFVIYKNKKFKKKSTILNPSSLDPSGQVLIGITKHYEFDIVFEYCKKLNLSINEFLIATLSNCLKKYFHTHFNENEIPSYIYATIPIGNTGAPKNKLEVDLKNSCSSSFVALPLIDDPFKDYQKISQVLKESVGNFSQPIFNKFFPVFGLDFLPNFIFDYMTEKVVRNVDMCISNVPGSKCPLFYAGCEINDIFSLVNPGVIFSFSLIQTFNNKLRVAVSMDKLLKICPDEITKNIEEILDNICN